MRASKIVSVMKWKCILCLLLILTCLSPTYGRGKWNGIFHFKQDYRDYSITCIQWRAMVVAMLLQWNWWHWIFSGGFQLVMMVLKNKYFKIIILSDLNVLPGIQIWRRNEIREENTSRYIYNRIVACCKTFFSADRSRFQVVRLGGLDDLNIQLYVHKQCVVHWTCAGGGKIAWRAQRAST